jgi:hypothetical protein
MHGQSQHTRNPHVIVTKVTKTGREPAPTNRSEWTTDMAYVRSHESKSALPACLAVAAAALLTLAACESETRLTAENPDAFYEIDAESAGVWETVGPKDAEACYWRRQTRPTENLEDVVEVGKVDDDDVENLNGTARITLHAGDWFIYYGCYPWRYVGPN